MCLFHLAYDMKFIFAWNLAFFTPPLIDIWRASISWTFLFIAGVMCSFSRNNFKRAGIYALAALVLFGVTSVAGVDTPISFGIIFCMAASTALYALLERFLEIKGSLLAAGISLLLFLSLLGLPRGTILFGKLSLPEALYQYDALAFLGLPGPGFASGDYYPLFPYFLMYLTGVFVGKSLKDLESPALAIDIAPLSTIGKHALPIYLLHQPIILAVLYALSSFLS